MPKDIPQSRYNYLIFTTTKINKRRRRTNESREEQRGEKREEREERREERMIDRHELKDMQFNLLAYLSLHLFCDKTLV